jgi:membrane protein YqaA with SNARE-associated domain
MRVSYTFSPAFSPPPFFPFSSEALLLAMALGAWGTVRCCSRRASATLGGLTNYGLGRWLPEGKLMRKLKDPAKAERWRSLVQRYGVWCALLCWLPVIGDQR